VRAVCSFFNHTRQSFYKQQHSTYKTLCEKSIILDEVRQIRKGQPQVGVRKLLKDIQAKEFKIGRDRLFNILRENDMLIKAKKRGPHTTYSNHWLHKYTNLIKGVALTGPNQVFVSDITYLRIVGGFVYLSLVTDAWSRKIVGWDVSSSLCVQGALRALKMALKDVANPEGLIHHSDRGIQYCCTDYVKLLKENDILISMTEENHCYENAIAERINGILKMEFFLNETLPSFKIAKELTREAIFIYNHKRRHMSLDYQIPAEVHHVFQ